MEELGDFISHKHGENQQEQTHAETTEVFPETPEAQKTIHWKTHWREECKIFSRFFQLSITQKEEETTAAAVTCYVMHQGPERLDLLFQSWIAGWKSPRWRGWCWGGRCAAVPAYLTDLSEERAGAEWCPQSLLWGQEWENKTKFKKLIWGVVPPEGVAVGKIVKFTLDILWC